MIRDATLVQTLIVSLCILLVEKSLGFAISLYSFLVALGLAALVMLGTHLTFRRNSLPK